MLGHFISFIICLQINSLSPEKGVYPENLCVFLYCHINNILLNPLCFDPAPVQNYAAVHLLTNTSTFPRPTQLSVSWPILSLCQCRCLLTKTFSSPKQQSVSWPINKYFLQPKTAVCVLTKQQILSPAQYSGLCHNQSTNTFSSPKQLSVFWPIKYFLQPKTAVCVLTN